MKTVGEMLKAQRIKVNLTLDEVGKKTKIQAKYLEYIETNDFKKLPTSTFVKGFIQNYAKAVGINDQTALAVFRRDFAQDKTGKIIPRSLITPIEKKFSITPKLTYNIIFGFLALLIVGLFTRQIISFYQGPEINLVSPQENQQVTSPVEIQGVVKNAVSLKVNNQEIEVSSQNSFTTQIQLSPGDHTITISAESRDGKTKVLQRHVTVNP